MQRKLKFGNKFFNKNPYIANDLKQPTNNNIFKKLSKRNRSSFPLSN